MKRLTLGLLVIALAAPLAAATWEKVALIDASCAAKEKFATHPENHTKACAQQCSKAGYGAMVDGKFVKFDAKGNELTADALKKSDKKDHLTVTINGEMNDGTIAVSSLKID